MKFPLLIVTLLIFFCSYGQEPAHSFELVFIDSTNSIITPKIWVKSKVIRYDELDGVTESEPYYLNADSLPDVHDGPVEFHDGVFSIYSILGGHYYDDEYTIKLLFNGEMMSINSIGFEGSGSNRDTIKFQSGNFVYLPEQFNWVKLGYKLHQELKYENTRLIELNPESKNEFCSFNCNTTVNSIDSVLTDVMIKSDLIFFDYLTVGNFPVGRVSADNNKISICYFSNDFIDLLKKHYD